MTCASYKLVVDTDAAAAGCRVADPVASSLAHRSLAVACVSCVGCRKDSGMGLCVGRAGAAGGRVKIPVVAVVSVVWQDTAVV